MTKNVEEQVNQSSANENSENSNNENKETSSNEAKQKLMIRHQQRIVSLALLEGSMRFRQGYYLMTSTTTETS
jgi:hypothetical protein